MAEIVSDGVRSVTSDDTSARDYSGRGFGYGMGYGSGFHQAQWDGEVSRDILAAIGRSELATEKIGAAGILQTQLTTGMLNVQAEKIGAAVNLAIEKTAAAGQLLAVQNAAAASLASATTTAQIQAALAACCCEIKELVHSEGEKTRGLISQNLLDEIRSRLVIANAALVAAKQPQVS